MWMALQSAMQEGQPTADRGEPGDAAPRGGVRPAAPAHDRRLPRARHHLGGARRRSRRSSPAGRSTPSSRAVGRPPSSALAVLIALAALLDAGIGLLERLKSSQLGERLILDLRRQVFEHVQRMPVAFFTRTHTGALVSRLNNDVIGAQRAFTSALAGVVTNVIALALTLVVMLRLSWQITAAGAWCCCRCSSSRPAGSAPRSACSSARRPSTTRR